MSVNLPVLDQGVGYSLIVGFGAFFAISMTSLSLLLARYKSQIQTSEMLMTANHSLKVGLIASAVVSSWTLAATLLSSTTEAYQYGVSGPFWYGAGCTIQIFLFAIAAIELKRKAPQAHTFLEVVRTRYGYLGHIVLMCYSLFFQIFTSVNLLVGGSTIFTTMTGMSSEAACFLVPAFIMTYTIFGGIKAAFLTDWLNTVVIYAIMLASLFAAYVSSSGVIGSPERLYKLLQEVATLHPVAGNEDGSYVTMKSDNGGYTGLVFIGAGFAAAVDSQLFQKAIAADPSATLSGYILGGLCWFTIPFVTATTFGLTAAATEHLPSFPTYPNRMTSDQVSSGMAMPFGAMALWGKGGAVAILISVLMAVTANMASETIANSALVTYDIYKAYINPAATGKQLVRVSHITIVAFDLVVPCIAIGLIHAGFNVDWLLKAIGIFVDSAIIPMACTILWRKQSRLAVVGAPLISSAAAITAWLLTAYTHYGEVTIATTSETFPLVAGNMVSLCGPIVVTPVLTYLRPDDFDWGLLKQLKSDRGVETSSTVHEHGVEDDKAMDTRLRKSRNKACALAAFLCLSFLILWPIPMYGTDYVFSPGFFKGWIVIVFIWAFFAAITITCLPIFESRGDIVDFVKYMLGMKRPMAVSVAEGHDLDGEEGNTTFVAVEEKSKG
ncbi:sodium:solute symporter family protein [Aspergillus glaucus CBS 516.65]|uniref:Urea active transporter n=1 Tax=Aspergillus glaucus CBS 516.65 TaxID=1160497 RepID=A0A1L9VAI3_ASPGL|nr:hypothetical protein ASPGLDRAFT_177779 [Aspergillus glaucus CBS 516.65]OJJ80832.1 hypothetical protein ASPGLDRAFT_177779 [Aspergillus glaucus CBS 516.65]